MSEVNWVSTGRLEEVAASLRSLLRRGLSPTALIRGAPQEVAAIGDALGVDANDQARSAILIKSLLDEAIDQLGSESRDPLRVLLDLDGTQEPLSQRRLRASESLGLTPESFRKSREINLIEDLAGSILIVGARDHAARFEEDRQHSYPPVDSTDFTKRFQSSVQIETSSLDRFKAEARRNIDKHFVDPLLKVKSVESATRQINGSSLLELRTVVLLGEPGSGKTTLVRYLARQLASSGSRIPFVARVADFVSSGLPLPDYLDSLIRTQYQMVPPAGYAARIFDEGRATLLLDGLDEVASIHERARFVGMIEQLVHRHPQLGCVVTSRPVGYSDASFDAALFARAELLPFDQQQQEEFVLARFSVPPSSATQVANNLDAVVALRRSPELAYLSGIPLILELLCHIVTDAGPTPPDSRAVLAQYVRLLAGRLDNERGSERALDLPATTIETATRAVARELAESGQVSLPERGFFRAAWEALVREGVDVGTARSEATQLLRFCRDQSWVLTEVGRNPSSEPLYGFTHIAFQEYFASDEAPSTATESDA